MTVRALLTSALAMLACVGTANAGCIGDIDRAIACRATGGLDGFQGGSDFPAAEDCADLFRQVCRTQFRAVGLGLGEQCTLEPGIIGDSLAAGGLIAEHTAPEQYETGLGFGCPANHACSGDPTGTS